MMAGLSGPVVLTMAGIVTTLTVTAGALTIANRRHASPSLEQVRIRVRTWWIMVGTFLAALALSRTVSLLFFAFVSFLALKEYLSIIPTRRADRRVLFLAYATIPVQYFWIARGWYGMFLVFIPVFMLLAVPARMALIGETAGFLRAAGTIHWGLMLTVFSISHLAFLLMLPSAVNPHGAGAALVLYLVLLTEGNDVAQFAWGRSFGRARVVPHVSPNKTWMGLAGGVLTTTLLGVCLAPWLTPMTRVTAMAAAFGIGASGFVGDIVVSALKRDLGLKDCSAMLPGHGGILDRIDSLTYTAPLFFHFVHYVYGGVR
jgi:phosphatidate cytidylyltransferase